MFSSAKTGCENKAKTDNVAKLILKNRRLFIYFSHNYDIDFMFILSDLFIQFKEKSILVLITFHYNSYF